VVKAQVARGQSVKRDAWK